MVKLFKLHKYSGLTAGVLLFILAITGFFLDHKNWSFMYDISFESMPKSAYAHEKRLIEAYWVDPKDSNHILVGSRHGIFEKQENGFVKTLDQQCLAIRSVADTLYAATSNGIYIFEDKNWKLLALEGEFINALAVHEDRLLASVDKKLLTLINRTDGSIISKNEVLIPEDELMHEISLSRFVRDLHYGRGLFDGISSLLINDYAALILVFLSLSGYIIWYLIKSKKKANLSKKLIRLHANVFVIAAIIPFIILLITGIFLDHPKLLGSFMRSVKIPYSMLPPVYGTLKEDIWSVDLEDKSFRVGNRYGIYESVDLTSWTMKSKGFAYRMKRLDDTLYISGMGAPNRIYQDEKMSILPKTPHMFKDINIIGEKAQYLSHKSKMELPEVQSASLYSVVLALHDGTFFSSWWVWINDIAAILLLVLGITGTIRYLRKKKLI